MVGPNDLPALDPTRIEFTSDDRTNPLVRRMHAWARHPEPYGMEFDVPFISEILPGFYQGGVENGLVLPENIEYVVSLAPWWKYTLPETCKARFEFEAYDDLEGPGLDTILEVANLVNDLRKKGPTLVHCQAGLNRSGLIAGVALILDGWESEDAIKHLRESRSPAVLCNPAFEDFVRNFKP